VAWPIEENKASFSLWWDRYVLAAPQRSKLEVLEARSDPTRPAQTITAWAYLRRALEAGTLCRLRVLDLSRLFARAVVSESVLEALPSSLKRLAVQVQLVREEQPGLEWILPPHLSGLEALHLVDCGSRGFTLGAGLSARHPALVALSLRSFDEEIKIETGFALPLLHTLSMMGPTRHSTLLELNHDTLPSLKRLAVMVRISCLSGGDFICHAM
jgi:hypothetical protein